MVVDDGSTEWDWPHEAVVENLNTLSDNARLVMSKKGDFVAIFSRRLT
jgi:hypothetical protein